MAVRGGGGGLAGRAPAPAWNPRCSRSAIATPKAANPSAKAEAKKNIEKGFPPPGPRCGNRVGGLRRSPALQLSHRGFQDVILRLCPCHMLSCDRVHATDTPHRSLWRFRSHLCCDPLLRSRSTRHGPLPVNLAPVWCTRPTPRHSGSPAACIVRLHKRLENPLRAHRSDSGRMTALKASSRIRLPRHPDEETALSSRELLVHHRLRRRSHRRRAMSP